MDLASPAVSGTSVYANGLRDTKSQCSPASSLSPVLLIIVSICLVGLDGRSDRVESSSLLSLPTQKNTTTGKEACILPRPKWDCNTRSKIPADSRIS